MNSWLTRARSMLATLPNHTRPPKLTSAANVGPRLAGRSSTEPVDACECPDRMRHRYTTAPAKGAVTMTRIAASTVRWPEMNSPQNHISRQRVTTTRSSATLLQS